MTRVRQHLAGDVNAGNQLVEKFGGLLQAVVKKRLGHALRSEAEDCYQELMLKVFGTTQDGRRRLQDWLQRKDRGPFCFWLMFVATRHVIDWNRRPLTASPLEQGHLEQVPDPIDDADDDEPGKLAAVYECLSQLDAKFQKLFRLRIEQQLPWDQVAEQLGVSERTAFNRWAELQRILSEFLANKGLAQGD